MAERVPIWYEADERRANASMPSAEPAQALAEMASRLRASFNLSGVAIAVKSTDASSITCVATSGRSVPALGSVLDVNSGICAMCVREDRTMVSNDTSLDSRVSREACEILRIRSLLVVPLRTNGECAGILLAASDTTGRFNPESQQRIEHEAMHAANALGSPANDAPKLARVSQVHAVPGSHRHLILTLSLLTTGLLTALLARGAFFRAQAGSPVHATSAEIAANSPRSDQAGSQPKPQSGLQAVAPGLIARADSGSVSAQVELAHRYFKGEGVPPDRIKASAWYIVAGENGDDRAKQSAVLLTRSLSSYEIAQIRFNVGKMYMDGVGIGRDLGQAYSWFALAQAAGDVRSATEQQRLEQMMTQEQVSQALHRASDWLLAHRTGKLAVPTIVADSSGLR